MDEGQNRLLLVLAAALLVVVGFLVLVEPPEKDLGDEKVKYEELVPDGKVEDIRSFTLTRGALVMSFERGEAGWTVRQGEAAPIEADAMKVEDVLADALRVELVETDRGERGMSADLSAFGLAPPVAVLAWSMADGASFTLRVGADSPVGYATYVQTAEGGPVRTTRSRLTAITGGAGTLDDYRSKAAVKLDPSEVTRLRLSRPPAADGSGALDLTLEEDAHGWWQMGAARVRADETRVAALLADLSALEVTGFPGASATPAEPVTTLSAQLGDRSVELSLGAAVDGVRVARVPLHDQPVSLDDALGEALARPAEEWLESRLLPVRSAELSGVEARLGDATLTVERGPEGWTGAASDLLEALRAVRVDRRLPAEAPTGEPWGVLRLKQDAGGEAVRIHQALADGSRVAIDEAGGPPFLVPAAELDRLREALSGAN